MHYAVGYWKGPLRFFQVQSLKNQKWFILFSLFIFIVSDILNKFSVLLIPNI